MRKKIGRAHLLFFLKNPAFAAALVLSSTLASAFSESFSPLLLLLPLGVGAWASEKKALCLALLALFAAIFYLYGKHSIPEKLTKPLSGTAILELSSCSPATSPFGQRGVLLKGKIRSFTTPEKTLSNLPVSIYMRNTPKELDGLLQVPGSLRPKEGRDLLFKPQGSFEIYQKSLFPWLKLRLKTKDTIKKFIRHHVENKNAASLLITLSLGDFEERTIVQDFARLGLQHLLAISGFHFLILAALLWLILSRLMPSSWAALTLIILLSTYFVLLGSTPSVERAYLSTTIFFVGRLIRRSVTPVNALGAALFIELLLNPYRILSPALALSFTATFAILHVMPFFESSMNRVFPQRSLKRLLNLPLLEKHVYLFLSFFKKSMTLNLAVLFATSFLVLALFHRLALHSLLYNLFVPPLIALILLLFYLAVLASPIPFLGAGLFKILSTVTDHTLAITSAPARSIEWMVHLDVPLFILILQLLLLLELGLLWWKNPSSA